jgi:hypothetical protein
MCACLGKAPILKSSDFYTLLCMSLSEVRSCYCSRLPTFCKDHLEGFAPIATIFQSIVEDATDLI